MQDEEVKSGYLVMTLKRDEALVIDLGDDQIEIKFFDRFKQKMGGKYRIRTKKRYPIKKVIDGKDSE